MFDLLLDEYIVKLHNKCFQHQTASTITPLIKVTEKYTIPTYNNYNLVVRFNYNLTQLKEISKHHKLKISGTKKELTNNIYRYLYLSKSAISIQKIFRRHLTKVYLKCHGPALHYSQRKICINETDFLSMDPIKDIQCSQFFSFRDEEDSFVYGFEILSFFNLLQKKEFFNPYNRKIFSQQTITNFTRLLHISNLLHLSIKTELTNINSVVSIQKSAELRLLDLFQNINSLGNYSEHTWFSTLGKNKLVKFVKELIEIWNYRSQINDATKRAICHPHGNPFLNVNLVLLSNENNVDKIKQTLVEVMENMVNRGVDKDSCSLGAYYVLGALTLVNENAAVSLPWLYQSFIYI